MNNNASNSEMEFHDRLYKYEELLRLLSVLKKGKTFFELDVKNVFENMKPSKGILGDVIEQSVLFLPPNTKPVPDIDIEYSNNEILKTEIKVTGLKELTREKRFTFKEPASITAVSIDKIVNEDFYDSQFYHKIEHMLWIFYLYSTKEDGSKVKYEDYGNFPYVAHCFYNIKDRPDDLKRFKQDWELTKKFLIDANKTENPEKLYPLLHNRIKENLMYLNIAPRYKRDGKNSTYPRFRFKTSYLSTTFDAIINKKKLETLPYDIDSIDDLKSKLHTIAEEYKGKTVSELIEIFQLDKELDKKKKLNKQICEMIVVRMLDGKSKKISKIELFKKMGLIAKTINLSYENKRREDMKLFTLDFNEFNSSDNEYENSAYYDYFVNKFLCIMFKRSNKQGSIENSVFLGFKLITFDEKIIYGDIKQTYDKILDLISNDKLCESYILMKNNKYRVNKNGVRCTSINLPKSAKNNFFVRGTGRSSGKKTWQLNGKSADNKNVINCYSQQLWIKGSYIVKMLDTIEFI